MDSSLERLHWQYKWNTIEINKSMIFQKSSAMKKFNQRTLKLKRSSLTAGSQREELRPWQRSWGRRLGIRKGGIKPQESPWIFLSIYPPKPESAYFTALCSHLWLYRGLSPTTISLSLKGVNLQLQLIKFLGIIRSVKIQTSQMAL